MKCDTPRQSTFGWIVPALLVSTAGCVGSAPPRAEISPTPARAAVLAEQLSGFIWPLPLHGSRELSSPFGPRGHRHHDGVDLRSAQGDPIYAAREGVVRYSGRMRGYGSTVIIEHGGGVTTLYAHASELYVRTGQRVERGEVIAAVGATGNATAPHLHFEIAWAGARIDPLHLLPQLSSR